MSQYGENHCINYKGNEIITMGPPSSGGVHIIQMLKILENYDLNSLGIILDHI